MPLQGTPKHVRELRQLATPGEIFATQLICRCSPITSSISPDRQPVGVFVCGNATNPECESKNEQPGCELAVGCVWCTGPGSVTECLNYENSTQLPGTWSCSAPTLAL